MWNVLTLQSQASVLVIMFTSKPCMSTIFDIARHLIWESIQMDECVLSKRCMRARDEEENQANQQDKRKKCIINIFMLLFI